MILMLCKNLIFYLISAGRRAPCTNENEDVPVSFLKNITNCFKCICKVSNHGAKYPRLLIL